MMVQRMIVLAGPPLDYNDNTRLKSGEGEKQREREGQREPHQQLICKSVALHKTVFVIGLELILQSAEEKALAISVSMHSHNYEIHGPPLKQHILRGWEVSWRQNTAQTGFNPPSSTFRHQTDKTHQLVTNTTFLSIYDSYMYVYQSASSINTAMQHFR